MTHKIKTAKAVYTGGNTYIYYGELTDGNFFRTSDGEDFIEICNSDTSVDEADYYEFYDEHRVETLVDKDFVRFWNKMLRWIIENDPYVDCYALESRMEEDIVEIEFSQGELKMMSDGLLALIEGNNRAAKLVYDGEVLDILNGLNQKYAELNSKICKHMEE